jgi:hypothetical protein
LDSARFLVDKTRSGIVFAVNLHLEEFKKACIIEIEILLDMGGSYEIAKSKLFDGWFASLITVVLGLFTISGSDL